MVNLDFEMQDNSNRYEVHSFDQNLVLVAWNGYSYTRIIWPKTDVTELINKIQDKHNETESI